MFIIRFDIGFLRVLGLGIGVRETLDRAMTWQRNAAPRVRYDTSNGRNGEMQACHALDASSSGFRRPKCDVLVSCCSRALIPIKKCKFITASAVRQVTST
jgi:hypothetical protein